MPEFYLVYPSAVCLSIRLSTASLASAAVPFQCVLNILTCIVLTQSENKKMKLKKSVKNTQRITMNVTVQCKNF